MFDDCILPWPEWGWGWEVGLSLRLSGGESEKIGLTNLEKSFLYCVSQFGSHGIWCGLLGWGTAHLTLDIETPEQFRCERSR